MLPFTMYLKFVSSLYAKANSMEILEKSLPPYSEKC